MTQCERYLPSKQTPTSTSDVNYSQTAFFAYINIFLFNIYAHRTIYASPDSFPRPTHNRVQIMNKHRCCCCWETSKKNFFLLFRIRLYFFFFSIKETFLSEYEMMIIIILLCIRIVESKRENMKYIWE